MTRPFDALTIAGDLLASLGYPDLQSVTQLPGGRNNQVWRVECEQQAFLLKRYFWSEQDPRDRLGQEWAFLHYLWKAGCRQAPRPLAKASGLRCALLEFVNGVQLETSDVTFKDVDAAADFFLQMNSGRRDAVALPPVSEACFSIDQHVSTTETRVNRLSAIRPDSSTHIAARQFVKNTIQPIWESIKTSIFSAPNLDRTAELPPGERCLSPSDFGFHNALRQPDGILRFLDFEYAGWDDPAKTIIDFCNQPDRLLPEELASIFRARAISSFPNAEALARRILLLEPLYQIKWACICLNNFLPGRKFDPARPDRTPQAQLSRARNMAQRAAAIEEGRKS